MKHSIIAKKWTASTFFCLTHDLVQSMTHPTAGRRSTLLSIFVRQEKRFFNARKCASFLGFRRTVFGAVLGLKWSCRESLYDGPVPADMTAATLNVCPHVRSELLHILLSSFLKLFFFDWT